MLIRSSLTALSVAVLSFGVMTGGLSCSRESRLPAASVPAQTLPLLVNEPESVMNWGDGPDIELYFLKNFKAIHEITKISPAQSRNELRRRLADGKLPGPLRLLYAGILAAEQDEAGHNFLIKQAKETTSYEQAGNVFWVISMLDWFIFEKLPGDTRVKMNWAKDYFVALLSDNQTLTSDCLQASPVHMQKRILALHVCYDSIARIEDSRILPLLVGLYRQKGLEELHCDIENTVVRMKDPRRVPFLRELIRDCNDYVSYAYLANAIGELDKNRMVQMLLSHMDEEQTYYYLVSYNDERVLPAAKKALPALKTQEARLAARLLIIQLEGGDRLTKLIELANDPAVVNSYSSYRVMGQIAELKDERSVSFAADELAKSPKLDRRVFAIQILWQLKSPAALRSLIDALDVDFQALAEGKDVARDNNGMWRGFIADHLKKITGKQFGLDKAKWVQWYESTYPTP